MAASLYKGQTPSRVKGQTTCIYHQGRQLELYCEQCKELACTQCLSNVHKIHPMCDIREICPQKKQYIENFIQQIENVDLVQIGQFITSTERDLKDNASTFEKLSHKLKNQTKKLKEDLDLITSQTLSLYRQMEEENTKLLQTYKQDLESYDSQLKQQIQECRTVLQRSSNLEIYDTWCDINAFRVTLPVKSTLGTAAFASNRNPQRLLKLALGEFSTSSQYEGECQGQASPGHNRSPGSSVDKGPLSTQQRPGPTGRTLVIRRTLLPRTKVMGEWQSPCRIGSLCVTTDGQFWTKYSKTLTLLDREGTAIENVKYSSWINAICMSPKTNTLWVCDDDHVMELVSGQLTHKFSTDEDTVCICITANNQVIVGMTKCIAKFTTKGKPVLTTMHVEAGKPLVRSPYKISEWPVTRNIAVVDRNSKNDGGDGNQQVVVIETDFKKLFVYGGEMPSEYAPHQRNPFDPSDVAYDSVGNLVIGDSNNCCILLISGRGEFPRVIYTDTLKTWAVCVDKEDVLWAVFGGDNVKNLQYSRVQ